MLKENNRIISTLLIALIMLVYLPGLSTAYELKWGDLNQGGSIGSSGNYGLWLGRINQVGDYGVGGDYVLFGGFLPIGIENPSSSASQPYIYELKQPYPNPFNPSTTIRFSIPKAGNVEVTIYNITGQEVEKLENRYKKQGEYEISFHGDYLPSGVYFCRMISDDFMQIRKMVLLK